MHKGNISHNEIKKNEIRRILTIFLFKYEKCLDNNINFMHANDTDVILYVLMKCAPSNSNVFPILKTNTSLIYGLFWYDVDGDGCEAGNLILKTYTS